MTIRRLVAAFGTTSNGLRQCYAAFAKIKPDGFDDEDFIFVKSNLKKKKVFLNELKYIEALGDYVKLVTYNEPIIVLSTMKAFEKQLPVDRFMRIHKSYIINIDKIEKYNSRNIEIDGDKIPLSRHKKAKLMEVLS